VSAAPTRPARTLVKVQFGASATSCRSCRTRRVTDVPAGLPPRSGGGLCRRVYADAAWRVGEGLNARRSTMA
jgi:hypothetical protein